MSSKGVLEGIRVVDWTRWMLGPVAGALLADLGADVIHIESRGKGDPERSLAKFFGYSTALPGGRHAHFEVFNRNKRSLALDLNKPQGRELIYRLVEKSDVFLTNCRPKAVKELRLDYKTLRQYNPQLIYAHATPMGERGAEAENPSMDIIGSARSGWMLSCGEAGQPPTMIAGGIGDYIPALFTAYGVIAALLARERGAGGQKVTTSQLGSLIVANGLALIAPLLRQRNFPRHDRARAENPLYSYYQCRDGRWIALAETEERLWPPFCQALGMPELAKDSTFSDLKKREENNQALFAILEKTFLTRDSKEWLEAFREHDLLAAPVNSPSEVMSDPQALANDYIVEWNHPALGPVKFVGFPVEFETTPSQFKLPAPELGQHTEEVLREIGYTGQDLERLKGEEVI